MKDAEDMSTIGPVIKEQQKILNDCTEKKISLVKLQSVLLKQTTGGSGGGGTNSGAGGAGSGGGEGAKEEGGRQGGFGGPGPRTGSGPSRER